MRRLNQELWTTYKFLWYTNFFHPQREANDSIIYDAEFFADQYKRLDEIRHEIAMQCVNLGIYKDVYEAKAGVRKKMIDESNYKYKHLLYRE